MVIEAGLIDAFERMPFPHLEFKDDSSALVQVAFTFFLGVGVGSVLYFLISEIVRNIFED